MTRIGSAYGASPLTFLSLAGTPHNPYLDKHFTEYPCCIDLHLIGIGDLMLTCTSPKSRNYTVGYRLGKGEKLDSIVETLGSVAEGVTTSQGLKPMTIRLGVHAPVRLNALVCLY